MKDIFLLLELASIGNGTTKRHPTETCLKKEFDNKSHQPPVLIDLSIICRLIKKNVWIKTTSKEVWDTINTIFEHKDDVSAHMPQTQSYNLRMYGSVTKHLSKLKRILNYSIDSSETIINEDLI